MNNNNMILNYKKQNKGFTIIEMIVVVGIFSIVMTIAMGAIFTVMNANRTAQATQSVMDNLNSALDSMSRNTRFGTKIEVSSDNKSFEFIPYNSIDGKKIKYEFIKNPGRIQRCMDGDCSFMTAPEVKIEDASFFKTAGSAVQPQLFLVLKGYAESGGIRQDFNIQTYISQRTLNI